jgi:hypothetical protein
VRFVRICDYKFAVYGFFAEHRSVYHSHWRSIRFADAVFGQADTAQLLYLSFLASTPARLSEKRILTNRTLRFVIIPVSYLGDFLSFLCVEAIRFCGSLCHFLVGRTGVAHLPRSGRGS